LCASAHIAHAHYHRHGGALDHRHHHRHSGEAARSSK
jgi:hypothetical protein